MVHLISTILLRCRPCDGRHWQCRHWSHGPGPRTDVVWRPWKHVFMNWTCQKMPKYIIIHTRSCICICLCFLGTVNARFVFRSGMSRELSCEIVLAGNILLWFVVCETVYAQSMCSHCHFTWTYHGLSIHAYILTLCPTYLIAILGARLHFCRSIWSSIYA